MIYLLSKLIVLGARRHLLWIKPLIAVAQKQLRWNDEVFHSILLVADV